MFGCALKKDVIRMLWYGILFGAALTGGLGVYMGMLILFGFFCLVALGMTVIVFSLVKFAVDKFLSWMSSETINELEVDADNNGNKFLSRLSTKIPLHRRCIINIAAGVLIAVLFIMVIAPNTINNDISKAEKKTVSAEKEIVAVENKRTYDPLQKIFIRLNKDTTEEHLKAMITANTLPYSAQEYSNREITYIVAFDESVTPHKHAKSGDYIKISFDKNGMIKHGEYVKSGVNMSALYYNFGTWWSLDEKLPENKYSGYYNIKYLGKEEGITIVYSNGNSIKTHYHPCESAEEAIAKL